MQKTTRILAVLAVLLFVWYLVADRVTPYTQNARMKAIVIDIVPQVPGYVSELTVSNGVPVPAGDLLLRIDPRPFALEVEQARANLQTATQDVGASSAQVEIAQASLQEAQINLQTTRLQSKRVFELERKGIVPESQGDSMRGQLASATSQLAEAEADLERARQQLGEAGADNARIRSAVAALGKAQLNLEWTELYAPARGVVVDLTITEGTFANAGHSLMAFISFDEVWVEAYLTENNIARIATGDPAELTLDLYPGRIFRGVVSSISNAASVGPDSTGDLPKPPEITGWMRDAQRFPVRIRMQGYEVGSDTVDIRRMLNGQADVTIYTGDNWFINTLAKAWLRLMSWLSYAY